jgi:serine/threonine protein kinase
MTSEVLVDRVSESRVIDEEARRRFEAAWIDGKPLPITDCLPALDSPAFLGTLEELVCIEMEMIAARRPGEKLRIEEYLRRFPPLDRPDVIRRLLAEEIEVRKRAGETVQPDEYERRFSTSLMPTLRPGADDTNASAPASESSVRSLLGPAQSADEIGRLGPYRVLAELGKGGMGHVFRAEDVQLRRAVALKVMLPRFAEDPRSRLRFQREARAAAALDHEHIVAIYQVGEDRGIPFVAMPLLHGEPLSDRLRRESRLPIGDVVRIGREIAEGLAAAHDHGLVHRDIKPANVFLATTVRPNTSSEGAAQAEKRSRPKVKILDFGLARPASLTADDEHLTETGEALGTPAYMSPEQARGEPTDARSDLFSLGCVLYQMATGELPFKGTSAFAIMTAISTQKPTPPQTLNQELPAELNDLILRLLAKQPADRPASAHDVAASLFELSAAYPSADSSGTVSAIRRPVRRVPTAYLAVLGIAIVAVAAIVVSRNWFAAPSDSPKGLSPTGSLRFFWKFLDGMPPDLEQNRTELVEGKRWYQTGDSHLVFLEPGVSRLSASFDLTEADLASIRGKRGSWRLHVRHASAPAAEATAKTKVRIQFNDQTVLEGAPTGPTIVFGPGGQTWTRLEANLTPWMKPGKNVLRWDYLSGPNYWLQSIKVQWETDGRDAAPTQSPELHRKLAAWALKAGATVKVSINGEVQKVEGLARMPAGDFKIASVALGGEVFGPPVSDVEDVPGGVKCLHFEGGAILMAPGTTTAYVLHGPIHKAYQDHGHDRAPLGRPIGAIQGGSEGALYIPFEHGEIVLATGKSSAYTMAGPIYEKYQKTPNHSIVFGPPISDEYDFKGGRKQDFLRCSVIWTAKDGARIVGKS